MNYVLILYCIEIAVQFVVRGGDGKGQSEEKMGPINGIFGDRDWMRRIKGKKCQSGITYYSCDLMSCDMYCTGAGQSDRKCSCRARTISVFWRFSNDMAHDEGMR